METIEDFKNLLGPAANKYDEVQLHLLKKQMEEMAKLLLEIYQDNRILRER